MIRIDFNYEDYKFSSISKDDVVEISKWMLDNNGELCSHSSVEPQILYRRFLEYYVTENEVYLKITKDKEIVGILKGRFEENKKFFIWLFIIKKELRDKGTGSRLLEVLIKYFKENGEINDIRVGVSEKNIEAISFWKRCEFKLDRISKNFFEGPNSEYENMLIMKR